MILTRTRQAVAVVVAVAVALSFVGAPVAAAALDTESGNGLDSLGDDSTSSADTADDSDGSGDDGTTDNGSTDADDDTDADDGSTTADTSDGDASDDDSTDGDDSSSDDGSLGSGDDVAEDDAAEDDDRDGSSGGGSLGSDGDDATGNESADRGTDRVRDAVDGTTDAVENTTAGLEGSRASLEDSGGVAETADGLLDSVSETALDLTRLDLENPFDRDDGADDGDRTYDGPTRDHHDEPPADDGAGADGTDGVDDDDATTAAGTGDGDRPDPADPAGAGAAIGLGAVATAAALRGSPVLAGSKAASSGGVLSTLLEKVRPFVFLLRYSRYDDSDPLEHEARERVYEIVDETPGSYLSEVSKEAGLPLSTTRHHIRVLEREDLVTGAKLHGKRRFYPAYAEGIELAAALNDDSTAKIIDAIARVGAASVSDLADELGRDPSTISHHLQRLEDDGVIVRERDGRAVVNRLSAEARTALESDAPAAGESGEVVAGGAD